MGIYHFNTRITNAIIAYSQVVSTKRVGYSFSDSAMVYACSNHSCGFHGPQ